jgi:hypothetical protein
MSEVIKLHEPKFENSLVTWVTGKQFKWIIT